MKDGNSDNGETKVDAVSPDLRAFELSAEAEDVRKQLEEVSPELKESFADELREFDRTFRAASMALEHSSYSAAVQLYEKALAKAVAVIKVHDEALDSFAASQNHQLGEEKTLLLLGKVPMVFCWCPATTSGDWKRISGGKDYFMMGSPEFETGHCCDEELHQVILTRGFWMGKYEVTRNQWKCLTGEVRKPYMGEGEDCPVCGVSWEECAALVSEINKQGGCKVSLPTEAQWEYGCRAGTTTPFSCGNTLSRRVANIRDSEAYGTEGYRYGEISVGSYASNPWGLCDMHGNVAEWCADWYGDYNGDSTDPIGPGVGFARVLRGGCHEWEDVQCRSASRCHGEPASRLFFYGFRFVANEG